MREFERSCRTYVTTDLKKLKKIEFLDLNITLSLQGDKNTVGIKWLIITRPVAADPAAVDLLPPIDPRVLVAVPLKFESVSVNEHPRVLIAT